MLDGLLQDRIPVSVSPEILILSVIVFSLIMVGVYYTVARFLSPIIAIIVSLVIMWLARYLYGAHGIIFDVAPILLAGSVFSFPMTFIYRFFIVERQRRDLQKNFAHYVDPIVVRKIAETGVDIRL